MKNEVHPFIGSLIVAVAAFFAANGILNPVIPPPPKATLQELAMVQAVVSVPTTSIEIVPTPLDITAGLLPKIDLTKAKKTMKGSTAAASVPAAPKAPVKPSSVSLTAQEALDATTLSFSSRYGGGYKLILTTDAGAAGKVVWGLDATTIGGTILNPNFSVTSFCDPAPTSPLPGAPDQNPTFDVRTSYRCRIDLTPLSGNDRRTVSKTFPFTTDAGPLVITPPQSMGTVLQNGKNDGGFTFDNQDAKPVTITGLTIDVSYTALNVAAGPVVLRLINQTTGESLGDYHLENLAQSPSDPLSRSGSNIQIPLSFTVKASTQKWIPLQILNVTHMTVSGVNPIITVTLRGVSLDPSNAGTKVVLGTTGSVPLTWTCIVPIGSYDPNAMTGAYATGQACQ